MAMERVWSMAFSRSQTLLVAALACGPVAAGQDASLLEAVKAGDRIAALSRIKKPGAVNAREADGTSALHWAARSNDLVLVQALLRAGADAKAVNRYGVTGNHPDDSRTHWQSRGDAVAPGALQNRCQRA
jgi:hypothetical protein